ncbi:acyl-CoA dehydrogenase family protein [Streptomyces sp. NBC_00932]|uniref:acyl-CoA dehydrogenase family protein n=1 Tax=Streptomyces sp. NBC_00932 TaxID=2903690 RepID=UPI00386954F6|nr:acyl-CoA/acyl-ACP dehydrogenase [Streptomyces sp. NBC_00932]
MTLPVYSGPVRLSLVESEDEESVRTVVRKLLADRCASEDVAAVYDGAQGLHGALWRTLAADLGLAGLLVPEEAGGAGAGPRETGTVLEELGSAVAPVPFLTSAVIATSTLVRLMPEQPADRSAVRDTLVAAASGELVLTLAVPWSTAPDSPAYTVREKPDGLHGDVTPVAGADAGTFLVPALGTDGPGLWLVDRAEVRATPVTALDMTRPLATLGLDGARARPVARGRAAEDAVRAGLLTGAGLLASEQVGLAHWCLTETVSYLTERRQFGRVVGGFQAIKHRMADLHIAVESARAAARYAAAALADDPGDAPVAVAVAASVCSEVAVRAAEECVQLHGGIGMTWEHPAHLRLKRAVADQVALGTPVRHRARLGGIVGIVPDKGCR